MELLRDFMKSFFFPHKIGATEIIRRLSSFTVEHLKLSMNF